MAGAALVVPVSGPYKGTYNGLALGTQNDDGFVLRGTYQGQEIAQSDAYGMTLVEAIYRGINWRLQFKGLEFNRPGMLTAMQVFGAFGASATTFSPTLGRIGDRYTKFSAPLVLNSILGAYPPTMPASLTALGAVVAPQSNIEVMMTSKMREAPLEMVLFPYAYAGSSVNLAFSTT
jgi:hypothetical protein